MFWVGTHIQSWNSEAQGQNSGRYVQMSSAHPSVPLLPLRMPLRLHHILLAAVLKKWKPQKVPKPPLSQQALPSLSERWKPSAPGQPTTVPGVMLSSPCNAGASRGPGRPPVLSSREGRTVSNKGYRVCQRLVATQCGEA